MTYQVKAINSDTDTCECCGKTNLNKVVWIVEVDQDNNETGSHPVAYGTTCAAQKLGFSSNNSKAQNEAKIFEAQSEYKNQVRTQYFNTECVQVDTLTGIVMIDRKYKVGQVMIDRGITRNQAITWIRQQMNQQWFM